MHGGYVRRMQNAIRSEFILHHCSDLHHPLTRDDRLILTYLIPCRLLTSQKLPTEALLKPYPRLKKLFLHLAECIKHGELADFDAALVAGEEEFVKRRIYLTLERGREIALRNLLRKVFLVGGFEEQKQPDAPKVRRTRIPIAEFAAAINKESRETLDNDEVECLLANTIYKVRYTPASSKHIHLVIRVIQGLMKGYIAREKGTVVLSKTGAFPNTGV